MNREALKSPTTILAVLAAALTCGAAFGLPVTEVQTHSILVFGGSIAVVLGAFSASKHVTLAPQTLSGIVAAAIGVAMAFGLQLTAKQQGELLNLTGVISAALLVHGAAHTVVKGIVGRRSVALEPMHSGIARLSEGLFILYLFYVAADDRASICHAFGPGTAAECTEAEARLKASTTRPITVMVLPLEDLAVAKVPEVTAAAATVPGTPGLTPGPGGPIA